MLKEIETKYQNHRESYLNLINTKNFINQLSVDCVIFGFHDNSLKVLLTKYHHYDLWAVPGGFIFNHENIDDAANRILYERTHLNDLFLEQFSTFGNKHRTDNDIHRQILKDLNIEVDPNHWIFNRFITIGYYSLIDYTLSDTFPDAFNESVQWYNVDKLPDMAFDHRDIVETALIHLRKNLDYKIMGSNLLPEKFTMKELQSLYECILNEKLRRNNFQRKMLSLNILERLEKQYSGSANKAPYLYKFKNL